MTGYRPGIYWQLTWRYIGPFIMCCVLISSVVFMIIKNPKYGAWSAELVSGIYCFLSPLFPLDFSLPLPSRVF